MRYSLFLAASSASASLLPRGWGNAPNVPDSEFPKFQVVTLEEAKQGKFKEIQGLLHDVNTTLATITEGLADVLPAVDDTDGESNDFRIAATSSAQDAASCAANPNMRFEWRSFSDSDRLAFVNAIKCLINKPPSGNFPPATNRYEDFIRLHQNYMPNVHNNAKFLLWHRYYTWTFEQVLRSECGYNRAFPWWDETLDAGKFAQSTMFTNTAYFGTLPAGSSPACISNGAFAGLVSNIGPGTSTGAHCVSRQVTESNTAQCSTSYMNLCYSQNNYADFESCLEYGPHGFGHNGIGGTMSDVWGSPSDPIFWMHHLFIDHGYRVWQNGDPSRITSLNGVDVNKNPLTLDTMVYMGGIRPDVRVRDIINTLGGTLIGGVPFCYRYNY